MLCYHYKTFYNVIPLILLQISLFLFGDEMKNIKNYILFLKSEFNLSVSLHPQNYDTILNSSELMPFNIHDNSYCVLIKSNPQAHKHCVECQDKVFKKCQNGCFVGVCYAGVKEFVYPIKKAEQNVGFISVSGYKTENFESHLKHTADIYGFSENQLKSAYTPLKNNYNKNLIDTLIFPLCYMLELALSKNNDTIKSEETLAQKTEKYIKQYRNQNITSKDICKHFSCSRSYMSTEFNKFFGKTIREYINELRIKDAKSLLRYSDLNITEIAFSVGFSDANYFSNLFKSQNGITPMQYRKTYRQRETS